MREGGEAQRAKKKAAPSSLHFGGVGIIIMMMGRVDTLISSFVSAAGSVCGKRKRIGAVSECVWLRVIATATVRFA